MYARRWDARWIWSAIALRYNPRLSATRQLGPLPMLGLWAALTLTGVLYASWLGYGGRGFAATLTAFAIFFLVMLLFAARGVPESLAARFGVGSGFLLGGAATTRLLARLRNHSGNLGGREILAVALVVALSRWAPRIRFHGAALRERRARLVRSPAPRQRHRLFHRLGPPLELFRSRQLHRLRLHRHSSGPSHPLHRICSALQRMEIAAIAFARDPVLYRLAGRISFPRLAPKHAGPCFQKRTRGLVDRFPSFWFLPHHQHGLSKLALRVARFHRGLFLWMDVAQDGLDFCIGTGPRRRGRLVAFFVPNNVIRADHRC